MPRNWEIELGDDKNKLSDGTVRIGYDADTGLYTWRRPDGVRLEGPEYGPLKVVPQWCPPPPPPPGTPWFCACCGEDKNANPTLCDCTGDCPVAEFDIPCVKCAAHCDAAWHRMRPDDSDKKKKPKGNNFLGSLTGLFKRKG